MNARSIQDENTRRIVQRALAADKRWELSRTGGGHGKLTWEPTGEEVIFTLSRSSTRGWRHLAADIERVSGVVVWRTVKRKAREYTPPKPQPRRAAVADRDAIAKSISERDARRAEIAKAERDAARERLLRGLMMPGG